MIPGLPHNVTQRGNNRQDIFLTDRDRISYLALLAHESEKYGLEVLDYCLMTNHVHLVVRPQRLESLAWTVGRVHFTYSQRFNITHDRKGHLFQARFYSCAFDEGNLPVVMRYVERNPVRAGIVGAAWKFPWSSAAAHVGAVPAARCITPAAWSAIVSREQWREFLEEPDREDILDGLRRRTAVGRPWGSQEFVAQLEARLGRQLKLKPVGRPPGRRK